MLSSEPSSCPGCPLSHWPTENLFVVPIDFTAVVKQPVYRQTRTRSAERWQPCFRPLTHRLGQIAASPFTVQSQKEVCLKGHYLRGLYNTGYQTKNIY